MPGVLSPRHNFAKYYKKGVDSLVTADIEHP